MFGRLWWAVALALALCVGNVHAQNLIVNGGFETGDFTGWSTDGAWFVYSPGYEGSYAATLATDPGTGPYTLWQTITTIPGQTYLGSAWFRNDVSGSPPDNKLEVYWNGNLIGFWGNSGAFDWEYHSGYVVGTGNDTLAFRGYNANGTWWLDDVRLEPATVPELPTLAPLALFSLSGLGLLRRRLRSS